MYKFPFDVQLCSLEFGSLVNNATELRLHALADSIDFTLYVDNKEFRYCDAHIFNVEPL